MLISALRYLVLFSLTLKADPFQILSTASARDISLGESFVATILNLRLRRSNGKQLVCFCALQLPTSDSAVHAWYHLLEASGKGSRVKRQALFGLERTERRANPFKRLAKIGHFEESDADHTHVNDQQLNGFHRADSTAHSVSTFPDAVNGHAVAKRPNDDFVDSRYAQNTVTVAKQGKQDTNQDTNQNKGCDEASTRVPFLGGWAETFPGVVERGTGLGKPGSAHCRIPFLFGTQRRPAALAILAPPESTSLYTRIPFLSGSIRPPHNRDNFRSANLSALDVDGGEQIAVDLSCSDPKNSTSRISSEKHAQLSSSRPALKDESQIAETESRSVPAFVQGAGDGAGGDPALRGDADAEGRYGLAGGDQAEMDYLLARARRAATTALDALRAAAVRDSAETSDGGGLEGGDEAFDLEADTCHDMLAFNDNRTVCPAPPYILLADMPARRLARPPPGPPGPHCQPGIDVRLSAGCEARRRRVAHLCALGRPSHLWGP